MDFCDECGEVILPGDYHVDEHHGRFCSEECSRRMSEFIEEDRSFDRSWLRTAWLDLPSRAEA